jgi:hypothetical protein
MRVRAGFQPGRDHRTVEVETNDPRRSRVSLKLSWQTAPAILTVPREISLGTVLHGDSGTAEVDLLNVPAAVRIVDLRVSSPALRAERVVLPESAAYRRVRVDFSAAALKTGEFSGEIRIRTDDAVSPSFVVPVHATVLSEYEVQPPELFLGFIGRGTRSVAEGTIHARTPRAAPLRLCRRPDSALRASLRPLGEGSYRIVVSPRKSLPSGHITEVVELAAGDQTLRVPIRGYVDPSLD